MNDSREALEKNSILECGGNRKIVITDAIGRGANCIVYNALYTDAIGAEHKVRVKECYPDYLVLTRLKNGKLSAVETENYKFQRVKESFVETYRKNTVIRNTFSLTNSTINATDIFEMNNTKYIVMAMDEGCDYTEYEDETLKELIRHIKSLALLIQKYHQNGYLHLDIKPENILILPETKEHLLLFDFDSVISEAELKKKSIYRLSFSEGYSAPEQIQGKVGKIGPCSDIYSIGAVFYYKLFGQKPDGNACTILAKYDFGKMKYVSELYNPRLYCVLKEFLKKTLSVSTMVRFNDMSQVINLLDELIILADTDQVYVLDSFTYNSSCFIGRKDEVNEIAEILENNQVVFLSGIGGIGKTEIAKYYANAYRAQYHSITFGIYEHSLVSFICNEIAVNKIMQGDEEDDTVYCRRKINVLKSILTEKDLIIVDNFDVDMDENLELLLECPCKFIFTTRKDFRDCNFKQINIGKIADRKDILKLFYSYNEKEYDVDEQKSVEDLIEFVDHHTMMVELIAKYLNNAEISPIYLMERFYEKEGITNTDQINVRQRKDKKILFESINRHLFVLFDILQFNETEKEIMSSLSLLAGIRIKKDFFCRLCNMKDIESKVEHLIKNGWIEQTDKISLHQIIQDIIYTKLKPDADSCKSIVSGMYLYVMQKKKNSAEREVTNRVFDVFMHRLDGNNIMYARLCLEYGKREQLDEARRICMNSGTKEAYDILQRICRKEINRECVCEDMFESELELESYFSQQIMKILSLLESAIKYCKLAWENMKDRIIEFTGIADEVDRALETSDLTMLCVNKNEELDLVYQRIAALYDWCGEHLEETDIPVKKKEELYVLIQKFYSDEDMFTAVYRNENFRNMEKAYYYQKKLDKIRECEEITSYNIAVTNEYGTQKIWSNDVSSQEVVEYLRSKGKYEEAIQYCSNPLNGENDDLFSIAHIYMEMGKTEAAIQSLIKLLEIDKENEKQPNVDFCYPEGICMELIKILFDQGDCLRAKKYAEELIYYKEKEIKDKDNTYVLNYILAAKYYSYKLEADLKKKDKIWLECLKIFEKLGQDRIESELFDFILEYLEKNEIRYEEIFKILDRIDLWHTENIREKILTDSIKKYENEETFTKYHILMLLKLAEIKNEYPYKFIKEGEELCAEAQRVYEQNEMNDIYLQNMIYKVNAEVIFNDNDSDYNQIKAERQKCDYMVIAKKESQGCTTEQKIKLLEEAADGYQYAEDYRNELKCRNEMVDLLLPILNKYTYSEFTSSVWNLMKRQIFINRELEDIESSTKILEKLLGLTIDYIIDNRYDKEEKWGFVWRLKDLAEEYSYLKQQSQAVECYIIAMYVLCTAEIDEKIMRLFVEHKVNWREVCSTIMEEMNFITNDYIDRIIDIKDEIMECTEDKDIYIQWPVLPEIIDEITKRYQTGEIEFKR